MKAKKMMAMLLAGAAALTLLAGCSSDTNSSGADNIQQEEQTEETESQADGQDEADTETAADTQGSTDEAADPAAGGKTLVVYYSASGNTERTGNVIADAAGADVFVIEPAEPYSSDDLDYNDDNSRVSVEHENPDAREVELVSATVEDWEAYDTVFIGYPKLVQGFLRCIECIE